MNEFILLSHQLLLLPIISNEMVTNLEPIMPIAHRAIPDPHDRCSLCRPESEVRHITQDRFGKMFLLNRIFLPISLNHSPMQDHILHDEERSVDVPRDHRIL
jgi:hypothetical protein